MAITVSNLGVDDLVKAQRRYAYRDTMIVVSALTANASNTIPHGLPAQPRRVFPNSVGNGAASAACNLDTSQGATDPTGKLPGGKLGYDATNVYLWVPAGTTIVELEIEY